MKTETKEIGVSTRPASMSIDARQFLSAAVTSDTILGLTHDKLIVDSLPLLQPLETEVLSGTGYFGLYFSSGDFVTRSAPTNAEVFICPSIKAVGATPEGTVIRLIDLDAGKELYSLKLRAFGDGEKWVFRFHSNTGKYPFPFMPSHNWHLRAQLEYPEGSKYGQEDVRIVNGPYSGQNPRGRATEIIAPSSMRTNEEFDVHYEWENIGNEVGVLGAYIYWLDLPNLIKVSHGYDIVPCHPEFRVGNVGLGFGVNKIPMKPYTLYPKLEVLSLHKASGTILLDDVLEKVIICTNPCSCALPTELQCYGVYDLDIPRVCYWENNYCGAPSKDCYPFLSRAINIDFHKRYPCDPRFDVNEDGKCDVYDIFPIAEYLHSNLPETWKILLNCNPDIDAYSREIKDWLAGLELKRGDTFYAGASIKGKCYKAGNYWFSVGYNKYAPGETENDWWISAPKKYTLIEGGFPDLDTNRVGIRSDTPLGNKDVAVFCLDYSTGEVGEIYAAKGKSDAIKVVA